MLQELKQGKAQEEGKDASLQQDTPIVDAIEPVRHQTDRIPVITDEKSDRVYEFECVACRQPVMLHKPSCLTCSTPNDYYEPELE